MIAVVRHFGLASRQMRAGGWQSTVGTILAGRTLGLLGLGRIGKRMAVYAGAFGMPVIAWSQNLTEEAAVAVAALKAGHIAGAGIDVFDAEPPAADHPFRTMDNVTITPHLGYVTHETLTAFYTDTLESVVAFADGAPIRVANPEALAHAKQRKS
jgi:phosphoglycerate dehydrogenase-like enzyme